ncbi:MAG: hypothetical protein ACYSWQ_07860 [Planctomycetota bacterium]|jgi:hypothetical protein
MSQKPLKTLAISIGVIVIGCLVFWLFYFSKPEQDGIFDEPVDNQELPVESTQAIAKVSNSDSEAPQKASQPEIDINDLPGFDFNMEKELFAIRKRQFAERERRFAEEVSNESTPEKVENLLYKTNSVGDTVMQADFYAAERYIATLQDHPRVKALLEVATSGSKSEKRELFDNLVKMCHVYLEELPLIREQIFPWQPSVMHPGGGKSFPYLLAHVDEDATTLILLAKMYLRLQKAGKAYFKFTNDDWGSSKNGLIYAYACDKFLNTLSSRSELQKEMSTEQLQVLKRYAEHRQNRPEDWNLERKQCAVMEFAVAFFEGEMKGGDETMR